MLDIHRYQCFGHAEIDLDIYGHMRHTVVDWKKEADDIIRDLGQWTYVGEWSLGLDLKFTSHWRTGLFNYAQHDMDVLQLAVAYRGYAAAQLIDV